MKPLLDVPEPKNKVILKDSGLLDPRFTGEYLSQFKLTPELYPCFWYYLPSKIKSLLPERPMSYSYQSQVKARFNWPYFLGLGWKRGISVTLNVEKPEIDPFSFQEIRNYLAQFKLYDSGHGGSFYKSFWGLLPNDIKEIIPQHPDFLFKDEWSTWDYFLGSPLYPTFLELRDMAHDFCASNSKLNLPDLRKSFLHKFEIRKLEKAYRDSGWNGWSDFFGYKKVLPCNRNKWDHEKAANFVRALNLKSVMEWNNWYSEHVTDADYWNLYGENYDPKAPFIPKKADASYKKDWKGWGYFLGLEKKGIDVPLETMLEIGLSKRTAARLKGWKNDGR